MIQGNICAIIAWRKQGLASSKTVPFKDWAHARLEKFQTRDIAGW